jgi:selenium metabolism protein YedF
MKDVDARGLTCPQPVLLTKKAIDGGEREIRVMVDGADSAENVQRFAQGAGFGAEIRPSGGWFEVLLSLSPSAVPAPASRQEVPCPAGDFSFVRGKALLLSSDEVGRGSEELGRILMRALLNALAENSLLPEKIILLNAGVKLACDQGDTVEALRRLGQRGVEILACGTCLKYYELTDRLGAGRVSNAYEILNVLLEGNSVSWA